jgi:peroxiredoxin
MGIIYRVMLRALLAILVTSGVAFAASTADDEIADLARRIQMLSAKESLWPRVDTELRAAELLKDVQPGLSTRFRDDAIRLFTGHQDLAPTTAIVGSLVALAPDRATDIVLSRANRRSSYEDLIAFYLIHNQPTLAVPFAKRAQAEGLRDLAIIRRLAKDLEKTDPVTAAELRAGFASAPNQAPARPAPPQDEISRLIRALKPGLSDAEKRRMIEDALASIKALETGAQQGPISNLMNRVEELKLDRNALEPVAAQFLYVLEHSEENPGDYDWLSALRRQYDLSVGSDNASVRSRDALAELAELVSTDYDFLLYSLDGHPVRLKDQRGKVVLLNFWATWCPPCREEMPLFEKLHREQRDKGLVLLAVSDEEPETVRSFLRQNGYTFPILLDPGRTVFDHYRVQGIPATKILDRTGRLRAEVNEIAEPDLRKLLQVAGVE